MMQEVMPSKSKILNVSDSIRHVLMIPRALGLYNCLNSLNFIFIFRAFVCMK